MPNMKCPECMGEGFTVGLFDIGDMFNDAPVVIKNAAGAKCSQCGYLLVSASVAKTISRMLTMGYSHANIPARLFDLAEVDIGTVLRALPPGTYTPGAHGITTFKEATPTVPPLVRDNATSNTA